MVIGLLGLILSFVIMTFSILGSPLALANDPGDIDSLILGAIKGSETGLPLPRFVSLKAGRTNMRVGPSFDHRISWVYIRRGIPVEIIQEFEVWRRIRDAGGQTGWVHKALLSSDRFAIIAPWEKDIYVPLHGAPFIKARQTAKLQAGVYASILRCEDNWCQLQGNGYRGWVQTTQLYGVYPGENF